MKPSQCLLFIRTSIIVNVNTSTKIDTRKRKILNRELRDKTICPILKYIETKVQVHHNHIKLDCCSFTVSFMNQAILQIIFSDLRL